MGIRVLRTIAEDWRSLACLGVLVLLGLGFALVPLARGEILFYWDNAQQHYPQTEFLHQALRSGQIPHWWPHVGAGTPIVAEGQAAHYHPIHLLITLLFSTPAAFMVEIGIYLAIAGVSTYFFLREFKLQRLACFVGGGCQMFCGFSIVFVQNVALHRTFCFLPLAMLLAERFATRRKISYGFLASLVLGMQLLAGHPTFALVTILATTVYIVCRLVQRSWHTQETLRVTVRTLGYRIIQWGLFSALGFGVAAIQTIPTILHSEQSIRQDGLRFQYAVADSLSAKIQYLPQLLFPYFYQQSEWLESLTSWGSYFNEVPYSGIYVGSLPAFLAFLGLWWRRRSPDPGWPLVVCCLVSTGLALGAATPLFPAFWSLPGMNGMRFPFRFLMWTSFCLACLAALGLNRLLVRSRLSGQRRRDFWPFAVMAAAVLLLAALLWQAAPVLARVARIAHDFQRGIITSLILFAVACGVASSLLIVRRRYRGFILALVVVFVFADLWAFRERSGYAPTVPAQQIASPPSVVDFLKTDRDQYRVMSLISVEQGLNRNEDLFDYLQADTCTLWGIESSAVYFSLYLKRYYAVHEGIAWELLNTPENAEKLAGFLGSLNVKYVVAPQPIKLRGWEVVHQTDRAVTLKNPACAPRAFLVNKILPERIEVRDEWFERSTYQRLGRYHEMVSNWFTRLEDAQIVDNILTRPIDYRTTAVVASTDPLEVPDLDPNSEVRAAPQEVDAMRFDVESGKPSFLVVSNNYYPGWTATVNGQPAEIHRTNYVGMGVFLPAGSSEVVFSFVTPGFRLGILLSLCSLGLTIGGLCIARWPALAYALSFVPGSFARLRRPTDEVKAC